VSDDELIDLWHNLFAGAPAVGSRWRHYRGAEYEVVALSLAEASLRPMITYRSCSTALTWTRRLEEWSQQVLNAAGRYVSRFCPVGEAEAAP
jgi:hypothetical protein